MSDIRKQPLLGGKPTVINLGLERFATDLALNGTTVVQVQWQPPARGDVKLGRLLSKLGR
jgi:FdrA protein